MGGAMAKEAAAHKLRQCVPVREGGALPRHYNRLRTWRLASARTAVLLKLALVLSGVVAPNSARAIDIFPRDFIAYPDGTNLTAFYYRHSHADALNLAGGRTITQNTHLNVNTGIWRQIYYGDLDGYPWAAQFILPASTVNGAIAGRQLQGVSGINDVLASLGISFLPRQPDRNLGILVYTSLPTGNYRGDRILNLGGNRWSFDTQLGYSQAIGRHFWFDAAADAILYTLNHDAGPAHGTLAQQPSYEMQAWFSYLPDIRSSISVGAAVHWGGAQSINQISTGLKTEVEQIRVTAWYAVTSAIHLSALLSHDVHAVGGYPQMIGLTLRTAFLF
jgi:hypothetical protein